VITVSTGEFTIAAGGDADVLVISNGDLTSADTFQGEGGTDIIRIDNATTLVDADFTNVTTTEALESATADVALNVTLGTEANESGLVDIDGGTAADIINGAGMTLDLDIDDEGGDNTITGGAGDDNIATGAGADTITGGAGGDTLNGGAGADIYVFSSTAALNGDDTISFVQADDRLDFSSFLSGGSVENNTVPVAAAGTDDIQLNNKLVILDDASADLTAAEVAAAIEGIGDALELTSGGKGIVLVGDDADANSEFSIYFVDDSVGANVGTVEADDVSLVGQSAAGIDADALANGNFIF
jgi:Ca2+-binding RTX toxin-like protein